MKYRSKFETPYLFHLQLFNQFILFFFYSYYTENSFNSKPYGECVEEFNDGRRKHWSTANNPEACADKGGQWVEYHNYLELAPDFAVSEANVS